MTSETNASETETDMSGTEHEQAADPVESLEAELAEAKDRVLRMAAEMDNLRKRTEREVRDAKTYAVSAFARDVLSIGDNLQRALSAVPGEADEAMKGFVEGVAMTEREFLSVLERHNIRRLDPLGERFDPNLHQAMFEAESPDHAAGHVFAVVQPGYAIGERVLRPALVGVSRGPGAAAAGGEGGVDRSV